LHIKHVKTLKIYCMKKWIVIISAAAFLTACGGGSDSKSGPDAYDTKKAANGNPSYDPDRGEGKFTHVDIPPALDAAKADAGQKIYSVKCSACHKLTDEKLVGPGWQGVTKRHKPEWILNFATNPDPMINKDPKAQAMLEICLVRMPNQNISDDDARNIYEFMRKNDGVK
jgi:mono/diheme cytochrome c family protein